MNDGVLHGNFVHAPRDSHARTRTRILRRDCATTTEFGACFDIHPAMAAKLNPASRTTTESNASSACGMFPSAWLLSHAPSVGK